MKGDSEHFSQRPTFGADGKGMTFEAAMHFRDQEDRRVPLHEGRHPTDQVAGVCIWCAGSHSSDECSKAPMKVEDLERLKLDNAAFKARLNDRDVFRVPRLDLVETIMPAEMNRVVFWGSTVFAGVAFVIAIYIGWGAFFAAFFAALGSHFMATTAKMAELRKKIVEPYEPDPERRRGITR